jgi:glycosyl transferase family 25
MQCFLINVDRAPERLAFMQEQFQRVGVELTRLPEAGKDLTEEDLEDFIRQRPLASRETWTRGFVCNFLSHSLAWERVASGEAGFAALFEDDVHIASDIATFLTSEEWIPADADIVRLEGMGTAKLERGYRIPACPSRRLHRLISGAWGAAGYVLAKKAAEALLAAPPRLHLPADHFMFTPSLSPIAAQLNRYQIVPSLCIQDVYRDDERAGLTSLITPDKEHGLPPQKKSSPFSFFRRYRKMAVKFMP